MEEPVIEWPSHRRAKFSRLPKNKELREEKQATRSSSVQAPLARIAEAAEPGERSASAEN
jgi:hypothetical protein